MAKELPLGVRLNNPGNLEWGSPWEGLVPRSQSRYHASGSAQQRRFCEFVDAASGIRAIARTLITYADKRLAADGSTIDTVREVISRWAPSHENNTNAYAQHVAKVISPTLSPDAPISVKDYQTMKGLVRGIIAHENAGYAYPEEVLEEGLRRAGVVPEKTLANNVPLTKEVATATAGVATGATALVSVIPDAMKALNDHREELASGDWKLMLIGGLLLAGALYVIWAQYKRRKAGAL